MTEHKKKERPKKGQLRLWNEDTPYYDCANKTFVLVKRRTMVLDKNKQRREDCGNSGMWRGINQWEILMDGELIEGFPEIEIGIHSKSL